MKDMDRYHCPTDRVCPESGSVMTVLLAAVAMVAVLGVSTFNILSGPVTTMSKTTYKSIAQNQIDATVGTIMRISSTDCDGDTYMEPPEARVDGTDYKLPNTLGVPTTDPWNTDYMYCPFDTGTVDDPACGGASQARYAGTTDPTTGDDEANYVFAVISAGPDKIFQTTCSDYVDTTTPVVVPAGDDVASSYTHDTARAAAPGIWSLKSGDPNTATIDKDVELGSDISIDEATGVGSFGDVSTTALTDAVGGLQVGDDDQVPACTVTDKGLMRYNKGGIEIVQTKLGISGAYVADYSVSFDNPVTAGNTVIALVPTYNAGAGVSASNISDNEANTYTLVGSAIGNTGNTQSFIFAAGNVSSSGGTFTITLDMPSNAYQHAILLEVSGLDHTNLIDQTGTTYETCCSGTTLVTTAGATDQNNELAVAIHGYNWNTAGTPTYTLDAGWENPFSTTDYASFSGAYKILTSTGIISHEWNFPDNGQAAQHRAAVIATFRGVGADAPAAGLEVCDGNSWVSIPAAGSGTSVGGGGDYWTDLGSNLEYDKSKGSIITSNLTVYGMPTQDAPAEYAARDMTTDFTLKSVMNDSAFVISDAAASTNDSPGRFEFTRERGTDTSERVINGDIIGGWIFNGYLPHPSLPDDWYTVGSFTSRVVDDPSGSYVPTSFVIETGDGLSSFGDGMYVGAISTDYDFSVTMDSTASFTNSNVNLLVTSDTSPATLDLRRGRGTYATPVGTNNGYKIGSINFEGYDGNSYETTAAIQAATVGPVNPTYLSAQLAFTASNTDVATGSYSNSDAHLRLLNNRLGIGFTNLSNMNSQKIQINDMMIVSDVCQLNNGGVGQTMPQQSNSNASGTITGTFASRPIEGNTVVVTVAGQKSGGFSLAGGSVTDNHGNTYTMFEGGGLGYARTYIFYATNININEAQADFDISINLSGTGNYLEWGAYELTGIDNGNPVATSATDTGTDDFNLSYSYTQNGIGVYIGGSYSPSDNDINTYMSSYQNWSDPVYSNQDSTTTIGMGSYYQILSVSGTVDATFRIDAVSGTGSGASASMIVFNRANATPCSGDQEVHNIDMPTGGYLFFHPSYSNFFAEHSDSTWTLDENDYTGDTNKFFFGKNTAWNTGWDMGGDDIVAIGRNISFSGFSVGMGDGLRNNQGTAILLSDSVYSTTSYLVVLGGRGINNDSYHSVALGGQDNYMDGEYNVAMGQNMIVEGDGTVGIGLGDSETVLGYDGANDWFTNLYQDEVFYQKYTATATDTVTAITVELLDGNWNDLTVGIYDSANNLLGSGTANMPNNNQLVQYYSIPLDTPVSLTSGNDYYIAALAENTIGVMRQSGSTALADTVPQLFTNGLPDPLPATGTETMQHSRVIFAVTNASTTTADKAFITAAGKVSIGATSSTETFEVTGTQGLTGSTTWTNTSDARLKDIHGPYAKGLNEILNLHPVTFSYKKDNPLGRPSDTVIQGLIAQEVQPHFPEAVTTREDGYLDLNMHSINVAMVNAVKELGSTKAELETTDAHLASTTTQLDSDIEKLEKDISRLEKITSDKRAGLYGLLPVAALLIAGGLYVGRRHKQKSEVSK